MITREKWKEVTRDRFKRSYAERHCPVVLEEVCNLPAVEKWIDFDYFLSVGIPEDKYVDVSVSEATFSGEISNHMEMRIRFEECIETMKRRYNAKDETKRRRNALRYVADLREPYPLICRRMSTRPSTDPRT